MVLDTSKHKIKVVLLNFLWNDYALYTPRHSLEGYVCLRDLVLCKYYNDISVYKWDNPHPSVNNAIGIYLGTAESITMKIESKRNPNDPKSFKKVFFDPSCTYPRFRLKELTSIKRCLNPSQADSVIISNFNLHNYEPKVLVTDTPLSDVHMVLYSKKENCYYFLDYIPNKLPNAKEDLEFQHLLSSTASPGTTGLHRWASALINYGILPKDCELLYYGKVVLLDSKELVNTVTSIFTKYNQITLDTELESFVTSNLKTLTKEDLDSIDKMLGSRDLATIDVGLSLLLSYNIRPLACSLVSVLYKHIKNINFSPVFKSNRFTYLLSTLGLTSKDFCWSIEKLVGKVYNSNISSVEDRKYIREKIAQNIRTSIQNYYNVTHSKKCSYFGYQFKFVIE